ncbi:MAG TPA: hypothetical protein ENH55_09845 [Aurantimonas coralicida]|uniref:Ribbon-helix-helix protein, CopG family n=2 Tax=root TaxID=1 RepID=A0A9C9TH14_9HYPH|nr:hypothetical protein [Aurantimonas coralicida]HEU00827.1 hypothetical protein [Aurantimonas coralicida]
MATENLSIPLEVGPKTDLEAEARRERRSESWIAERAIEAYLAAKKRKREAIDVAVTDADKGVFVSKEAVDRWVESWSNGEAAIKPAPDILPPDK